MSQTNPESAKPAPDEPRQSIAPQLRPTPDDVRFMLECGVRVQGLDLRDQLKVLRGE